MENEKKVELIRQTLDVMCGHKYKYGGKTHTIKSYSINEERERVQIQTNLRFYDRDFDSFQAFIGQLDPIEESGIELISSEDVMLPKMQIDSVVIAQLKDVLLDNIAKVKQSKEYIPQATAVKLSVDSVIDLAKIEVAYMEAYVRVKKQG